MRISRLHLHNVKRHGDLTLDLAPGLTVIRGPNEAGKTTIQRALEIALFRRPTSTAQELDGVRRWGVNEDPQVTVTFEEDGAVHQLRKRFAGQRGTVEMRSGSDVLTDPATVEQLIISATGLPSEKFFRATASVHHHELAGLDQDAATLRDRLQQSMSGADKGTYATRRKLEEAIRRYRTDGPKNPGYVRVARTEVERLEAEVAKGEASLEQLEHERRLLTEIRDSRMALDAKQAELSRGVDYSRRAVALHRRAVDAEQRYNLYRRAAELQAEVERLESSHPARVPLASLRAAVERLRNIEYRRSEIRAELASEPDLSAYDVSIPAPRWRPWAVAGILASVGAVLVVLGGTALGLGPTVVAVAAVLAATGMLTAYYAIRQQRVMRDIRLQNELRDEEIRRRLR
ncbi:MAG TPA: AAA family ATPase, partial [Candidatus Caenarcaniphilales bacterium]|nr:AAA family ATPase [Candidatus Caenarcaniphilales bacterium]